MTKPDIRMHNDGQDFICMDCGTVIPRTRSNPYPEHKCKTDKEKVLAKWPDAHAALAWYGWVVYGNKDFVRCLGDGDYENAAWADAARKLK